MGSRSTLNSLQTAPPLPPIPAPGGEEGAPSQAGGTLEGLPSPSQAAGASVDAGISPAIATFIARTVQAALAADRLSNQAASIASTSSSASVVPSVASLPPSSSVASAGSGGVLPSLDSSANSFLAAGARVGGVLQQGRPSHSMSLIAPSFVSTFSNPLMSSSVCSAANVCNLQSGATRDVADRSAVLTTPLLDQPFVVGPGVSPVPAKIVAQIVAGKYIDLSELLAVNLVQQAPEPQLLFDGRLVLTSQPKKQRRRIEDITSWTEAFAMFSLILVSHFPHRWKDLMQYQLLILRTYRHFAGGVWLAYDQAFREHAAATRLTDWSGMNAQLFNFHAAGSSVRSASRAQSNESLEPPGSSLSVIDCKSWNRGRCTAPFASCRYAHRCSVCSGSHRVTACTQQSAKYGSEDSKRRGRSPSASGSSPRAKARRN